MMRTVLKVADNSGVKLARCIHVNGSTGVSVAGIGKVVVVAAREVDSSSKIKKGDKHLGLIVRTKTKIQREDGSYISFSDNAIVLVDKNFEPIATRVFGPVAREVRKVSAKIASLASEVL